MNKNRPSAEETRQAEQKPAGNRSRPGAELKPNGEGQFPVAGTDVYSCDPAGLGAESETFRTRMFGLDTARRVVSSQDERETKLNWGESDDWTHQSHLMSRITLI